MTTGGHIHGDHPFMTVPEERDPIRQLRGRLASAVTVFTSGSGSDLAGLTISSVMIAEGDPPRVVALVNDATDLKDALELTERFVLHVLERGDEHLSEEFAGLRPRPGGVFSDRQTSQSHWGPVLVEESTRASCTVERMEPLGGMVLLVGRIDRVELGDVANPLVYFRGGYRRLIDDR